MERLRMRQEISRTERAVRLIAHGGSFAALRVADRRSPDEIIGYDEVGLPR